MRTQTILLACALLATLFAQLPVGVAVTCAEDPDAANCLDCTLAANADNPECATVPATTEPNVETTLAPVDEDDDNEEPSAATTEAPTAATTEANDADNDADEKRDCPCRRHRRRRHRGWRRGGFGRGGGWPNRFRRGGRRSGRFRRGGWNQGGWGRGNRLW